MTKKLRVVEKALMKEKRRKGRYLPRRKLTSRQLALLGQYFHHHRKLEGPAGPLHHRALSTRQRHWLQRGRHTCSR